MSFLNGNTKLISIFKGDNYFPIGCLTSNSFSESSEVLETTTRDSIGGWKTFLPTNQSYSISFSGLVTTDDIGGTVVSYDDLVNLKRNKTQIFWRSQNEKTGYFNSGRGYIVSLSDSAEIDNFIQFDGEIQGFSFPEVLTPSQANTLVATLVAQL
jgi:predicted secreted protein